MALAAVIALALMLPANPDSYVYAYRAKHRRLRELGAGKLVVCGGSNVAFGIDTQRLGDALGRDGVNMGIHAGIGLAFMCREITPQLREGDLVVVCPEYEQIGAPGQWRGDATLGHLVFEVPEGWRYIRASNLPAVLPPYCQSAGKRLLSVLNAGEEGITWGIAPVYNRGSFNRFGDVVAHREMESDVPIPGKHAELLRHDANMAAVLCLRRLKRVCNQRRAQLVVMPPCLMAEVYGKHQQKIDALWESLRGHLGDIVRGTPREYAFDRTFHFDTAYHLNQRGIRKRTALVEAELADVLAEQVRN